MWLFIGLIFIFFAAVVFRGAPYVPTRKRAVMALLNELSLKPGDVVVDIGSGDGIVLKTAAERGFKAVGYEINPFLCAVAFIRCWPVRRHVTIYWRDFWLTPLPKDAKVFFVFLAGPFMKKFARKIATTSQKCLVASNGFEVPGWKKQKTISGIHIYSLPGALQRGK